MNAYELHVSDKLTADTQTTKETHPAPSVILLRESCSAARTLPHWGANQSVISQLQIPALFSVWTALFTDQRPDVFSVTSCTLLFSRVAPKCSPHYLVPFIFILLFLSLRSIFFFFYWTKHKKPNINTWHHIFIMWTHCCTVQCTVYTYWILYLH